MSSIIIIIIIITRPQAALWAAGLAWIVGPGLRQLFFLKFSKMVNWKVNEWPQNWSKGTQNGPNPKWPELTKIAKKRGPKWPKMGWMSENKHTKRSPSDFCSSCNRFEWSHDQFTAILNVKKNHAYLAWNYPRILCLRLVVDQPLNYLSCQNCWN